MIADKAGSEEILSVHLTEASHPRSPESRTGRISVFESTFEFAGAYLIFMK